METTKPTETSAPLADPAPIRFNDLRVYRNVFDLPVGGVVTFQFTESERDTLERLCGTAMNSLKRERTFTATEPAPGLWRVARGEDVPKWARTKKDGGYDKRHDGVERKGMHDDAMRKLEPGQPVIFEVTPSQLGGLRRAAERMQSELGLVIVQTRGNAVYVTRQPTEEQLSMPYDRLEDGRSARRLYPIDGLAVGEERAIEGDVNLPSLRVSVSAYNVRHGTKISVYGSHRGPTKIKRIS